MSEENAEVVRQFYEALERADVEAMLELTDPDVRIHDPDLPGGGEFEGRESAREFIQGWRSSWDEYSVEIEDLRLAGSDVVVLTRHRGRGKGSTVPVELADAHVLTLRDRRVVYLRTYLDRAQALQAVGLSD